VEGDVADVDHRLEGDVEATAVVVVVVEGREQEVSSGSLGVSADDGQAIQGRPDALLGDVVSGGDHVPAGTAAAEDRLVRVGGTA
jgi:ornithine cyclodeaminase/alanine dehydrogenase-like protein (mu-crystallin family)